MKCLVSCVTYEPKFRMAMALDLAMAMAVAMAPVDTPRSAGLEEQNRDLAEVKVDEVLGLVRDVRAEVPADDHMPRRVVLLVELLLDEGSDVFFDIVFFEGLRGAIDGVLLHVFGHVCIF